MNPDTISGFRIEMERNPDDLFHPMALADYLDDHDEPDRAALVRFYVGTRKAADLGYKWRFAAKDFSSLGSGIPLLISEEIPLLKDGRNAPFSHTHSVRRIMCCSFVLDFFRGDEDLFRSNFYGMKRSSWNYPLGLISLAKESLFYHFGLAPLASGGLGFPYGSFLNLIGKFCRSGRRKCHIAAANLLCLWIAVMPCSLDGTRQIARTLHKNCIRRFHNMASHFDYAPWDEAKRVWLTGRDLSQGKR